jgi:hypothetical protein
MDSGHSGPTRSQQTNLLLQQGYALIQGQGDPAALAAALLSRQQALHEAQATFELGVSQLSEERSALLAEPVAQVRETFEAYVGALGSAAAVVGRAAALREELERLAAATDSFLSALDAYDTATLAAGPTPYLAANALAACAEAVRDKTAGVADLMRVINDARAQIAATSKELETPAPELPAEAVARLREGFEQYRLGVEEMARYAADSQVSHLDDGLDQVFRAHDVLRDGYELYRRLALESGPTASSVINTFLNAARMLAQGRFDRALFVQSLAVLEDASAQARKAFVGLCNIPTESARIHEQIPKALEAFDANDEAHARFRTYLDTGAQTDLEAACQMLVEATLALAESQQAFEQVTDTHGIMLCTRCSATNAPGNRQCCACGAALPRVVSDEASSTFSVGEGGAAATGEHEVVITEHLKRIIDETNAVAEGRISHSEYAATLAWMEGRLQTAEKALAQLPRLSKESLPEEEREHADAQLALLEDTFDMAYAAIATTRQGLAHLGAYLGDQDQQHLLDGLPLVWEGSQQMTHLQRVTEMAAQETEADLVAEGSVG